MSTSRAAPIAQLRNNISIRPWHPDDAASLATAANHASIAAAMRDRFPSPYTAADAAAWIALNSDASGDGNGNGDGAGAAKWVHANTFSAAGIETEGPRVPVHFAIVAADSSVIGGIGLELGADVARRTAELGYWLAPGSWGRGIMGEAVAAFCAWAWAALPGLVRVHADIFGWNVRSGRVLEKAGFVFEGRLRAAVFKGGKVDDVLMYAVVREGF